jgi:hypothetical protein
MELETGRPESNLGGRTGEDSQPLHGRFDLIFEVANDSDDVETASAGFT